MVQPSPFFFSAMAMTVRTEHRQTSLKRRIRQFYRVLNQRAFDRCFRMIDPRVLLKPTSVTLFQYESALGQFLDRFGSVKVLGIDLDLHLGEASALYQERDFAVGKTTWADESGEQHVFSERWVWDDRAWYTRSTGFVTPAAVGTDVRPSKQARHAKGG
jgi:hypothetical protein